MAEVVFVGRRRHPAKIVLYSLLTFGVYGRVFVYRTLKEIEGHDVLFLDLRIYKILLVLPIVGPLIAKWRLAGLLPKILKHDVTASHVSVPGLRWAALVPWFPLFHVFIQLHLTPHWELHRKMDDLDARREVAEALRKGRTKAAQEELAQLEEEIRRREQELENARAAALAYQAAREAKRLAEKEIRKAGGRPARLKSLVPSLRLRRRPGVVEDDYEAPVSEPSNDDDEAAQVPRTKVRLGFFRRKPKAVEPASAEMRGTEPPGSGPPEAPPSGETKPSWKDRFAAKKAEREQRKADKRAAKLAEEAEPQQASESTQSIPPSGGPQQAAGPEPTPREPSPTAEEAPPLEGLTTKRGAKTRRTKRKLRA